MQVLPGHPLADPIIKCKSSVNKSERGWKRGHWWRARLHGHYTVTRAGPGPRGAEAGAGLGQWSAPAALVAVVAPRECPLRPGRPWR